MSATMRQRLKDQDLYSQEMEYLDLLRQRIVRRVYSDLDDYRDAKSEILVDIFNEVKDKRRNLVNGLLELNLLRKVRAIVLNRDISNLS